MRAADPRTREILERTESLSRGGADEAARRDPRVRLTRGLRGRDELLGAARAPGAGRGDGRRRRAPPPQPRAPAAAVAGATSSTSRSTARPRSSRRSCESMEGVVQLAVTVEDDPGRDLGEDRQIGHRFFFSPDEVEPLGRARARRRRRSASWWPGIGNVFLGDDGFGVEVAGRLARSELPAGVDVEDFGIRGMDLAYALAGLRRGGLRRRGAARRRSRHAVRDRARARRREAACRTRTAWTR